MEKAPFEAEKRKTILIGTALFCVLLLGIGIFRHFTAPSVAQHKPLIASVAVPPATICTPSTSLVDLNLVDAVRKGDAASASLFLTQGASPSAASKSGIPVLCAAANRGYLSIVQMLLDKGCNVNIKMIELQGRQGKLGGLSALHFAAVAKHDDIVRFLLSKGADINLTDAHGDTALGGAAIGGDPAITQLLLDAGSDIEHKGDDGLTPLMLAAGANRPESIRVLLTHGADLNYRNASDESALTWAEGKHSFEAIKVLQDAEINAFKVKVYFVATLIFLVIIGGSGLAFRRYKLR